MGTVFYGLYKAKEYALSFTTEEPRIFQYEQISDDDYKKLTEKIKIFKEDIGNTTSGNIALNAKEVNSLFTRHEDFKKLKDIAKISFKNNKLLGLISFPLERFDLGIGKGRYLNGSASFEVSVRDGRLFLYLEEFEVKDKKIPAEIMKKMKSTNLAEDFNRNPEQSKKIKKIKKLYFENEELIIEL
ncbi:MAG: hypothetical protein U9O87_10005 [Verrucomicrobiota bacterium]|nr:hypothetical protein [Verrucomicrobiota bacterium]